MGDFKGYREESKTNWGTYQEGGLSIEQIQTGCLLRIADATELMAQNYVRLQNDLETERRWRKNAQAENQSLANTIRSLRGHITRLNKKLNNK